MSERSQMISWMRGELVGPSTPLSEPFVAQFNGRDFADATPLRRGPLAWRPEGSAEAQEVLYYDRESPHRKYGAGLLHPAGPTAAPAPDQAAVEATDTLGVEPPSSEVDDLSHQEGADDRPEPDETAPAPDAAPGGDSADDFEVTSPDVRHPSTIGISFCVYLEPAGRLIVRLPQSRRFAWQDCDAAPFPANGRYELCTRRWNDENGALKEAPIWRRLQAVLPDAYVTISRSELVSGRKIPKPVTMPDGSPITLVVEVFPRQLQNEENVWLFTVVLRNTSPVSGSREARESVLYQTCFEASVEAGRLEKYPESRRPFAQLDPDEQSLALLYRESATWAIGHGCAAAWDAEPGQSPPSVYADVMPAVQLPSMTPNIEDSEGRRIELSMRALASLSDDGAGPAWTSLQNLAAEYSAWIHRQRNDAANLPAHLREVADRHLDSCNECLARINRGIELLRDPRNGAVRTAFRLANLAMLLQQIATKQLSRRPLQRINAHPWIAPQSEHRSPWHIYQNHQERDGLGAWRAFQIAFLLMSLDGVRDGQSPDRELVDLIWFPTGGGKTEAYLAVMAFYMFHQRLQAGLGPRRDGTNVIMRYTLRMLTTQQFQRAASLICAMEFLRRNPAMHGMGTIPGARFSLGLWIGSGGSPNDIAAARVELTRFRRGDIEGNPLVLTECPWCRAEIGRFDGARPATIPQNQWNTFRSRGISDDPNEGPLLLCTDSMCQYGREHWQDWLPIEVIDQRIYRTRPSLVIATADKFAIVAYRPAAGAIFGRSMVQHQPRQDYLPPGLIIQDELHLISGPLGTMYALYEGAIERLCSYRHTDETWTKPKLIASTATIRGAAGQVRAVYARSRTQLFPSPGLLMGDSFFGKYAREQDGRLSGGRLYLGIHASDYGSILTTQVRTFSAALFRPFAFAPDRRDPWWTLLAFYNSIRELGGAKTLFDSDIRSRLKFMFNRENFPHDGRRNLRVVEELTSRLSQAEIVQMMDRLSAQYAPQNESQIDACLASNIIEVGVDIERLSIMAVIGQPKTTSTYIQVTGRVGRKWWERAGLILTLYNPGKSRDRSHFEQFHSYHRRLYERVEPTSATPFAVSAIQRALGGILILWARQHSDASVQDADAYADAVEAGYQLLRQRCQTVQPAEDLERSLAELERIRAQLDHKWNLNPQQWETFPPTVDGEYLMLWPGQFATIVQRQRGVPVPSSMRQVDGSAELTISQGYIAANQPPNP